MNEQTLSPALRAAAKIYVDVMSVFLGPYNPPAKVAQPEIPKAASTAETSAPPPERQEPKPRDTYGRPVPRTPGTLPVWGPHTHSTGQERFDKIFKIISNTSGKTVSLTGMRTDEPVFFMALNPLEVDNLIEALQQAKVRAFKVQR